MLYNFWESGVDSRLCVHILGDVIVDRYYDCSVFRTNLEIRGTNVVDVCRCYSRFGGSTNVANIIGFILGKNSVNFYSPLTVFDEYVINGLEQNFTFHKNVLNIPNQSVPIKDRFISDDTYIVRIDYDKL